MKLRALFFAFALFLILPAYKAQAALVDYTTDSIFLTGTLQPGASATFEMTLTGNGASFDNGTTYYSGVIRASYPNTTLPYTDAVATTRSIPGTPATISNSTVGFYYYGENSNGGYDTIIVPSLVLASSNLINATQAYVTFTNNSSVIAQISGIITGDSQYPGDVITLVSVVPLPTTFLLFLTAMLGLASYAYWRKARI